MLQRTGCSFRRIINTTQATPHPLYPRQVTSTWRSGGGRGGIRERSKEDLGRGSGKTAAETIQKNVYIEDPGMGGQGSVWGGFRTEH